jgi:hypothetical protein
VKRQSKPLRLPGNLVLGGSRAAKPAFRQIKPEQYRTITIDRLGSDQTMFLSLNNLPLGHAKQLRKSHG